MEESNRENNKDHISQSRRSSLDGEEHIGEQRATLNIGIGWRGLNEDVERFKDNLEFTKLKNNQEGIDPDNVYSQVPYEKGFQFLWRIERQVSEFICFFWYVHAHFASYYWICVCVCVCFGEILH